MTLTQQSCEEFVDLLASAAPTPGGGGASALVGAVGAALGNMVGSLTLGKKKYAAVQDDIIRLKTQAQALQDRFLALVQRDAEAFSPLAQAYGLPKETPAEQAHRTAVMEQALRTACAPPLEIMEACCETVVLLEKLAVIGAAIAISDVGCGAVCCRAALRGASLNVFINTKSMQDRDYAAGLEQKADAMLADYLPRCDAIFESVARRFRQ